MTDQPTRTGASELLRSLGLYVDGPARWAARAPSRAPGVFVVELPGGRDAAPIDVAAVRRWLERLPQMAIDGERATVPELVARLSAFWLPAEPILYVGRSARQLGGRIAAMYATELGDSRPHSGGHWLKTLSMLADLRVWWAETDAHEEYEDALLAAVAERNDGALPFANLSGADGTVKAHGLANSLRTEPTAPAAARSAAPPVPAKRRATRAPSTRPSKSAVRAAEPPPNAAEPTVLSREGLERLTAELDELRTNVRPQVIARVKAARELGDLRENADYEYARKEQSFVEGRIQTLEAMVRRNVLIEDAPATAAVGLGSTVVVESDGERQTYLLVGPAEADPSSGRISHLSPVGRALLGAHAGDEVAVQLPAREARYRVIEVR